MGGALHRGQGASWGQAGWGMCVGRAPFPGAIEGGPPGLGIPGGRDMEQVSRWPGGRQPQAPGVWRCCLVEALRMALVLALRGHHPPGPTWHRPG